MRTLHLGVDFVAGQQTDFIVHIQEEWSSSMWDFIKYIITQGVQQSMVNTGFSYSLYTAI